MIGLAHLALFKVLPGPTDALEIAAYLAGGSAGIVASIWAHRASWPCCGAGPRHLRRQHRRRPPSSMPSAWARRCAWPRIADESARADVESWCSFDRLGNHTWYDIRSTPDLHGREEAEIVATALRYLRLRDRVVIHPTQAHLVRFER